MTPAGRELMSSLFPAFNQHESTLTGTLSSAQRRELADMLRAVTQTAENGR